MASRKQTRKSTNRGGNPNVGLQVKGEEIAFVAGLAATSGPVKMDWEGFYRVSFDVRKSEQTAMFKLQCLTETEFDVVLKPRLGAVPEPPDGSAQPE